jgi:hypothetical protein
MPTDDCEARYKKVKAAFEADNFKMIPSFDPETRGTVPYLERQGFIACAAENLGHLAPVEGKTRIPKVAYYVEGSNYLMGYFMGLMAEPRVSTMAVEYADNVIFDFLDMDGFVNNDSPLAEKIKDLTIEIVYKYSQAMIRDVPYEYVVELKGMLEGCFAANPSTKVTWDRLWALNYGIDCLIAHIYTGQIFKDSKIKPQKMRVPVFCNSFMLGSPGAEPGSSFFGRDFMFPTAGVFQDVACLIIQKPEPLEGVPRHTFVSQTAPGIVGSVVAMNEEGLGIGIEMLPTAYCDPDRPGFNALGLNRDVAEYAADAAGGVDHVGNTQRGVSWIYAIADKEEKACILETGRKPAPDEAFPYLEYVTEYYKKYLPTAAILEDIRKAHGNPDPDRGMIPRWKGYDYPVELIEGYNPGLFKAYNHNFKDRLFDKLRGIAGCLIKLVSKKYANFKAFLAAVRDVLTTWARWKECDSGETGFYPKAPDDYILPGPYYFAPQREARKDLVIGTNHFITPEMRLVSMTDWLELIEGDEFVDSQWRYDALNSYILETLAGAEGKIGFEEAWKLVDFLDPLRSPKYSFYYRRDNPKPPEEITVHGSVNLLELKSLKIRSLWGYYGDEAVTISLKNYL